MTRYTMDVHRGMLEAYGNVNITATADPEGKWVKYDDVKHLLSHPTPDTKALAPKAEDNWSEEIEGVIGNMARICADRTADREDRVAALFTLEEAMVPEPEMAMEDFAVAAPKAPDGCVSKSAVVEQHVAAQRRIHVEHLEAMCKLVLAEVGGDVNAIELVEDRTEDRVTKWFFRPKQAALSANGAKVGNAPQGGE